MVQKIAGLVRRPTAFMLLGLPPVVLLGWFTFQFDPTRNDIPVTLVWAGALVIWLTGAAVLDPPWVALRPCWRQHIPVMLFLLALVCVWLPFYNDWRFVVSGDSFPWFDLAYLSARHGFPRSFLSVRGIWDHFTFTQVIVDNFLMFVVQPTFFWHRASKLVSSVLGLLAMYGFFSLLLKRPWPFLIVIAVATNFMWIIFSFISYHHIDSFIFAYGVLAAVTLAIRDPDHPIWWVVAGTVAGLSLFFTQTAWAEVSLAGMFLGLTALYRRRFVAIVVCAFSFGTAAWPMLLQIRDLMTLNFALHAKQELDWSYLVRMLQALFWLPYGSGVKSLSVYTYFFPWPCGPLYLAGLGIAAVHVLSPVRRLFRTPLAVAGIVCLFAWDVLMLALTNYGFPQPSPKRSYHLLPLQVFFCMMPLFAVFTLVHRKTRNGGYLAMASTGIALVLYAGVNLSIFVYPSQFGGTVLDGLVELHQRFPRDYVLLFDARPHMKEMVEDPESLINRMYGVGNTVNVTSDLDKAAVVRVRSKAGVLCYYVGDRATADGFAKVVEPEAMQLERINLYDVPELACFRCS
jgi:hypothetical protein